MVQYRFSRFQAAMVADGSKRRTIRALGRNHAKPGAALQLMVGLPRPAMLLRAVCAGVDAVEMTLAPSGLIEAASVNGAPVADLEAFALLDGFESAAHMGEHFLKWHGPGVFRGVMILW